MFTRASRDMSPCRPNVRGGGHTRRSTSTGPLLAGTATASARENRRVLSSAHFTQRRTVTALRSRSTRTATQPITYVLDTSVLLSDPSALRAFEEHSVVLPLPVISELEAKRHHPELGW